MIDPVNFVKCGIHPDEKIRTEMNDDGLYVWPCKQCKRDAEARELLTELREFLLTKEAEK